MILEDHSFVASERTVSMDPGLMTEEELLAAQGDRRQTLERMVAARKARDLKQGKASVFFQYVAQLKKAFIWLHNEGQIKISYDDFMMIITIFVLFGDDVRLLSFSPSADGAFSVCYSISFFLFLYELVQNCWLKSEFSFSGWKLKVKGYMFSFFFWLDLLAILSMVPELPWLSSALGIKMTPGSYVGSKAGRAGKIGAKTGRVVRMVRLVRLVKLYKITSQRRREKKLLRDFQGLVDQGNLNEDEISNYLSKYKNHKQSKVGAELSDIITRRVIVAVLLMLCVIPYLSYSSSTKDEQESMEILQAVNIDVGNGNDKRCDYLLGGVNECKTFLENMEGYSENEMKFLVSLEIMPPRCNSTELINFKDEDLMRQLRSESLQNIVLGPVSIEGEEYSIKAIFNLDPFVKEASQESIYLTLFVIFMLVFLSVQFNGDAQKLVLTPLEEMMEMVNMVADDPLEDYDFKSVAPGTQYETRLVQLAIQRITALLRVGFGVAGAEIISTNMTVEGEGTAVLKPMIPGKRIYAIFGFCDIHAFDLCTEKLEDEIMTFVNNVARIVHEEVTRWGGLCNKNLGNAFLMVWRIGDEEFLHNISGRQRQRTKSQRGSFSPNAELATHKKNVGVDLKRIPGLDLVSDKALIGFLRVVIEVNRDPQVLAYRSDSRLTINKRNFALRMGFGLHAGWAIEGAVGSLQKVDATYLSPHVNMAARMEAASRQFGVALLMTEKFHELMSSDAQEHCRKLDVVTVKGSTIPMPIYTYDTFQNQKFPLLKTPKYSSLDLSTVLAHQAKGYTPLLWTQDQDLVQLRRLATPEFKAKYQRGLNNYLNGNWAKARPLLEEAEAMMSENDTNGDGPSRTLLNYMSTRGGECPSDWNGFRPLTNK